MYSSSSKASFVSFTYDGALCRRVFPDSRTEHPARTSAGTSTYVDPMTVNGDVSPTDGIPTVPDLDQ